MIRGLVAAGLILSAALVLSGMDRRDAAITAQHVRAASEKKADVKPEDRVWMRFPLEHFPLECRTWISNCPAGEVCKPRYVCTADLTRRAAK